MALLSNAVQERHVPGTAADDREDTAVEPRHWNLAIQILKKARQARRFLGLSLEVNARTRHVVLSSAPHSQPRIGEIDTVARRRVGSLPCVEVHVAWPAKPALRDCSQARRVKSLLSCLSTLSCISQGRSVVRSAPIHGTCFE